jgi:GNAT superfamily N-acetyltransferase
VVSQLAGLGGGIVGGGARPVGGKQFDFSTPTDGSRLSRMKYGDTEVALEVTPDDIVKINSMRTPVAKRGQGSAKIALKAIVDQADQEGKIVKLDASALDAKTSTSKLVNFYKKFGFTETGNKINQMGDPEMIRLPAGARPVGGAKEINTIPPKGAYISYGKNADPFLDSEGNESYGPEHWLIEKLFVPEEYRGTGVGSAMVKNAIHEMIKEDASKPIRLSADPFGKNAMSHQELADWYKKLGFDEETYTEGMSGVPMRYYGKDPGLQNIPK